MKRWKKIAVLMSIVLLMGEFPSSSDVLVAKATTTQQQITQTQTEKNELESQLGQTNEELEDLKGEQKTLQGELKKLNEQLTAVSNHLEELEGQIKEKCLFAKWYSDFCFRLYEVWGRIDIKMVQVS